MSHDRWFVLGVIGAVLSCLACVTPLALLALGAIGLSAWAGRVDAILLLLLVACIGLAVYRYRAVHRDSGRAEGR